MAVLVVLLMSLLGVTVPSPGLAQTPDLRVAAPVVQIRGMSPDGRLYFGSGVVVDQDRVATNCHVIRNGGRIAVFRAGEGFSASREQVDVLHDVCILDVPGLKGAVATLGSSRQLKVGQGLSFYGYPRALGLSYSEGQIRRIHPMHGRCVIETSAFFTLGGSGGGLFDRRGRLVGLATFLAPGHAGGYFAVPADWVISLRRNSFQPIAPLKGRYFWESEDFQPLMTSPPRAVRP